MTVWVAEKAAPRASISSKAVLWAMFFLIAFGLGYATLNRYSPAETGGVRDSHEYFRLVTDGPAAAAGHWRYRILVPYLAKPLYLAARGHVGSWNPVSFSMLVVNSAFCAASAMMLLWIAHRLGLSFVTGFIASLAFLANFVVINLQLAGLVDSAECFLLMCVFLVCLERKWYLLPLVGMIGALAKETFLPLAFLFIAGWILRAEHRPWGWLATMAVSALAAVVVLHSLVDGHLVTPLQIAAGERNIHNLQETYISTRSIFTDWTVWISFLWLIPFVVPGRDRLPESARLGTLVGAAGALALSIWNWSGGNAVRPVFDVSAVYLCIAFAVGATRFSFDAPVRDRTASR